VHLARALREHAARDRGGPDSGVDDERASLDADDLRRKCSMSGSSRQSTSSSYHDPLSRAGHGDHDGVLRVRARDVVARPRLGKQRRAGADGRVRLWSRRRSLHVYRGDNIGESCDGAVSSFDRSYVNS